MANRTLAVKVQTEVSGTDKVRGLGSSLAGVGVQLAKAGAIAGAAFAGVGALTAGFASDLNESLSKVGVVFGDSADDIERWSETAAESMGLSQQAALEAAGTYGNLFDAMGIAEGASSDMSTELVELASDLASFNNIGTDEALEKLRAGLVGEAEPLRTLGVNISAAATEAKALELGLLDDADGLSAADKAMANYALIMEQTTNAQGDFARTSDGMANQQRILAATFDDTMADVGQAFIPLIEAILPHVTAGLRGFGDFISANMPTIQGILTTVLDAIGAAFGFLVDVILPAVGTAFAFIGTNVLPSVTGAFNGLATNVLPILLTAFEAVADFWTENGPTIMSIVGQVFGAIVEGVKFAAPIVATIAQVAFPALGAAAGVLLTVIDTVFKGIGGAVEVAGTVIGTVVEAVTGAWEGLMDFFRGAERTFRAIGEAIFEPFATGFEAAVGVIHGIWNAFARFWNGLQVSVPAIDVPFLGRIGGFTIGLPDLPTFAEGGIVTRPTLGIFGEAGPEAVVPLDRMPSGDVNVYVTVNGDVRAESPDVLADTIRRSLWASGANRAIVGG